MNLETSTFNSHNMVMFEYKQICIGFELGISCFTKSSKTYSDEI